MHFMQLTVSQRNGKLLAFGQLCIIKDLLLYAIDSHHILQLETGLQGDDVQKDIPKGYTANPTSIFSLILKKCFLKFFCQGV